MKILAITQARIGSSRFPEKILKEIEGESLLEMHINRILKSENISKLKIATTIEPEAQKIVTIARRLGIDFYQGAINNVLERFYNACNRENPDWVVRLTSDCPLIDALVIDEVVEYALDHDYDYVSNGMEPSFPDGISVEVLKMSALERAYREATLKSELEHVTPYIWKNSSFMGGGKFRSDCYKNDVDYSKYRLTVDTFADYELIKTLVLNLGAERPWIDYVKYLSENAKVYQINQASRRNDGYRKSLLED
jgi:spore coat polysaccharide biosynthesis protein SpsF